MHRPHTTVGLKDSKAEEMAFTLLPGTQQATAAFPRLSHFEDGLEYQLDPLWLPEDSIVDQQVVEVVEGDPDHLAGWQQDARLQTLPPEQQRSLEIGTGLPSFSHETLDALSRCLRSALAGLRPHTALPRRDR